MPIDRFEALADPFRRSILVALARSGPAGRTVGDLARELDRGRPLVSYHLGKLVGAGLASVSPDPADARRRIYRVAPGRAGRRPAIRPLVGPADAVLGALAAPGGGATDAPPARAVVPPRTPQPLLGSGLSPEVRARLERFLQHRRAESGEILFSQEDDAAGIWLVESGTVRLYTSDADGREQTLQIVAPGSSFNEVPFFDGGPEPATAIVVEDAELLVLPSELRDQALRAVPELAIAAAASFAFRLRQAIALVEDLSFRQVGGRVARVLLQAVAPHPGVGAGSGGRLLTQREIAEMVGSSREVVARTLRQLEREGLIRMERGRIVLLDREGLAARE